MIRGALAALILIASTFSAAAQEHVTAGVVRLASNGPLFLAAAQGYFKANGLELELRAYSSAQQVARALADGVLDFGVAAFSAQVFQFAGKGVITAVAAQARERRGYEGDEVVVQLRPIGLIAKSDRAVEPSGLTRIERRSAVDPAAYSDSAFL